MKKYSYSSPQKIVWRINYNMIYYQKGDFMEKAPIIKNDKEYKKYVLDKINEFNTNGKKTVVYFCDTYFPCIDGVIVVLDNYAEQLAKFYNVVVVAPCHKKMIAKQDNYLVIGSKSLFFKFVNYDLAFPGCDGFLKKALKLLKIDLIHAHSPFSMGKLAAKLAKKRGVPFVMTMHSQYKKDFAKFVKSKAIVNAMAKGVAKVFDKATEVWTMHHMTADILRSYGYTAESFFFMPNACNMQVPADREKLVADFNKMYGLDNDMPVFMFLGRIVKQKNVFFIVDALKILDGDGLDFRMYFIGSGPDEEELKKYVKNLGLEEKIAVVGRIDDRELQSKYYQRSNLFLFPSKYDMSSIVQIEAALHQTPGVYIKGAVTTGTITDRVNGYLSDDDVNAYAKTILEALQNKSELEEISQNAFKDLYVTYEMLGERAHERYEYLMENNKKK